MTNAKRTILEKHVHEDETIEIGPRGGRYVLRDNIRCYLIAQRKRTRPYRPPRGAYQRFFDSQI